mmetsp:Transcript_37660/g.97390  ORF Transcript_37660/g.97390 Transcript_37660/m.97390 type:complete len:313 (-) Transcript_37660:46-984(-)
MLLPHGRRQAQPRHPREAEGAPRRRSPARARPRGRAAARGLRGRRAVAGGAGAQRSAPEAGRPAHAGRGAASRAARRHPRNPRLRDLQVQALRLLGHEAPPARRGGARRRRGGGALLGGLGTGGGGRARGGRSDARRPREARRLPRDPPRAHSGAAPARRRRPPPGASHEARARLLRSPLHAIIHPTSPRAPFAFAHTSRWDCRRAGRVYAWTAGGDSPRADNAHQLTFNNYGPPTVSLKQAAASPLPLSPFPLPSPLSLFPFPLPFPLFFPPSLPSSLPLSLPPSFSLTGPALKSHPRPQGVPLRLHPKAA